MTDKVTLSIDGVEVSVEPGKTILQAAMDAGIYVPYLCYYPGMKPYGACRMCVVEVENIKGTPASCTTPVSQGMVVHTKTDQITELRKGIMELLISEHPHGCLNCHRIELCGPQDVCLRHVGVRDRCVTCPKNERCELKDTVRYMDLDLTTPFTYNYRNVPREVRDPFWDRDMNLCIVCGRCVRVCEEVRGDNALTFIERSGVALIGTSHGTSLLESGCEFCGACIDICPTGALVERDYKWDKATQTVDTICPHCPVGCQVKLEVNKRGKVIRSIGELHGPANRGQICFKGKFGMEFVNSNKRIHKPLIRRNGSLEETTWDEALGFVAQQLESFKGDRFALLASPRGTNEDFYTAQKFSRAVMGANNVDISSNVRPELVQVLGEELGCYAGTNSIWELESARCVMVVSSNVTEEHNVVAVPIKRAVKKGTKLVVIDSREVELTRHATLWLRPKPGTEHILVGGILRSILDHSMENKDAVTKNALDMDSFKSSLSGFELPAVEKGTDVSQDKIEKAASLYAAGPSSIVYALDTVSPEKMAGLVKALVNLALLTGNIGKPSAGLHPLFPGANEQGAKDMGCNPGFLPGYASVKNEQAKASFKTAWGVEISSKPGLGVSGIVSGVGSRHIDALYLSGDMASSMNGSHSSFLESLKNLKFLVVQDSFLTEAGQRADVVLPSTTFAEDDGTYTSMERRIQLLRPVLRPSGDEKPGWWILSQLAQRMGAQGFTYETSSDVTKEISFVTPIYAGVSQERLQKGSVQWPVPAAEHPGTPILYAEGFGAKKLRLTPVAYEAANGHNEGEYPFLWTQGRVLAQPTRDLEVEKGGKFNHIKRSEIIEIHPDDAASLKVADGDWIEIIYPEGRFRGVASLTSPHKKVVSTTMLFGDLAVSLQESTEPDVMRNVPGLPVKQVKLQKIASS